MFIGTPCRQESKICYNLQSIVVKGLIPLSDLNMLNDFQRKILINIPEPEKYQCFLEEQDEKTYCKCRLQSQDRTF